jgi:predicted nucleic acid-binding protein
MVLVDTSVWVRFLRGRLPYAAELDRLLAYGEVAAHDFVYGELLMGDSGDRGQILSNYPLFWRSATIPHGEVAAFVSDRKLKARGIGWIDAHLLASVIVERIRLWTADAALASAAEELGVKF